MSTSDQPAVINNSHPVSSERARYWLDRWDRQQEYYMPDREDRFAAIGDLLEICLSRPDALVVDLGVGPGSLAHRLITRFDRIDVVGVDADPLLLELADAAYGSSRFRTVRADLRRPDWFAALGLDRAPDAFVSTTALHWINKEPLRELLAECGKVIAPGGVFIDADHLYEGDAAPRIDEALRKVTADRLARIRPIDAEDWGDWWKAVEAEPELAAAVAARDGGFDHTITDRPTVGDYLQFLRDGGFTEAGIAWQIGDDRILLGLADADTR
ncbi:class I SAM-dependent methyltransferase [Microlunatus soli]|uniref:Methyltransferase domain-containing protein n=1 Tax=Microlunatus soli TaxID=630515 RepID=A0A1H1QE68_9ACTN|nr:class I SAM-dependent methyltransferase [Microlunatus soli]SDS21587.1 Methyltransferase domain-containing protein [Microlunatus soli]